MSRRLFIEANTSFARVRNANESFTYLTACQYDAVWDTRPEELKRIRGIKKKKRIKTDARRKIVNV